jgi:chemotaxis signal transduction protein
MTTGEERFLLARVRDKILAFPLRDIAEVMETFQAFPLPKCPPGYVGIMNFHGSPRPVLDLSSYLHGETPQQTGAILVLEHRIGSLALRVDTVEKISVDIHTVGPVEEDEGRTDVIIPSSDGNIPILSPERLVARLEEELISGNSGATRAGASKEPSPAG